MTIEVAHKAKKLVDEIEKLDRLYSRIGVMHKEGDKADTIANVALELCAELRKEKERQIESLA